MKVILEFLSAVLSSRGPDILRGPVEVDGSVVVFASLRAADRSSPRWRSGELRLDDPPAFSWRKGKREISLPGPLVVDSRAPQVGQPWGNFPGSRIFTVTGQDHRYEIAVNSRSADAVGSVVRPA